MQSVVDKIKWRWLAVLVMIWAGYIMHWSFDWVTSIPHDQVGMHHAGLIAAVYAPVAAIFKFAFDFALDGENNSN
jgi:hypothetical protein